MPTKAYSYIRISSSEQRKGRGEERQLEAARAYADQHALELDDSLRDLGRSGFHGHHVSKGALGRFLDLVADGQITVGSYLLVENLDRLSRQTPIDAQAQFIAILQAGIRVVTLTDGQIYERGRDFTQMIISLTIMSRGHEESARKSYNSKKNHDANRRDMLEGKPRFQSGCVGWIDQKPIPGSKDVQFTLNAHAKTVQRIFELADQGVGNLSIARLLNEANTPPLKAIGTKWWETTVVRILKNENAIGTLQVHDTVDRKLVPIGDPIPNYYPAAVSEELFWRVQRNRAKTSNVGRKGAKYANLFQNITRCVHCNGGLGVVQSTSNDYKYFRCKTRYQDKTCSGPSTLYPYHTFEDAVLDNVTDFYLDSQLGHNRGSVSRQSLADQIATTSEVLTNLEKRRKNAMHMAELADDDQTRTEFMSRIRELRVQIEQHKGTLTEANTRLKQIDDQSEKLLNVSDMIAQEQNVWKTGTEQDVFVSRAKTAQAIRRFISQIQVDFEQQTATVYVAGYTCVYMFDRYGKREWSTSGSTMPFSEIEKVMRMDNADEAAIALAKEAHAKIASNAAQSSAGSGSSS